MSITVYGHLLSQPTRAVAWFCMLANIPHKFEVVDMMKGEHKQEKYLKINPSGLVPAMRDEAADVTIGESNAILQYLSECEGVDSTWFPTDRKQRAKVLQYLHWHHTGTRKLTMDLFRPVVFAAMGQGSANVVEATEKIAPILAKLNEWLAESGYVCGTGSPSIADIACYCEVDQLKVFNMGNLEKYPAIGEWIGKMEKLPFHEESHKVLNGTYAMLKDKL